MTHHTDAEQAEFERLIKSHGGPAMSLRLRKNEEGTYHWAETQGLFEIFSAGAAWQAARRTPAVHKRCDLCKDDGGYFYGRTGYEPCCVDAAAPQPPKAAPVELPEPFTTLVRKKSWSPNCYEASPLSRAKDYGRQWADERINVYTEQQVRDLLAAHGIQEQST